jgi:beta-galactosidase
VVEVSIDAVGQGTATVSLLLGENCVVAERSEVKDGKAVLTLTIPNAQLWSPETPNLYTCRVAFAGDKHEETFGVRVLSWDRQNGFAINGKRYILRGGCIHHDNGLLGACCFADAEERKIRILKENGYNAIRSAHNPCSKAMLDACDRLGILVMDEFVDCWYIHKTKYDYVSDFETNWKFELLSMVKKDYNHPSVVMYSIGNEVSETAQERGIALTGEMTAFLHQLDGSRPVTCGVNIFFNFLSSIGFGVYSDDKANQEAEQAKKQPKLQKKKKVGSEFYNTLATLLGDTTMKVGATFYGCDVKTRGAFSKMDIAGYNYGILRYKHDLKKYPRRLIVGSETFCKDAYRFYEMAKQEPGLIGDFVWAGMDYLGEVSSQTWAYEDEIPETPYPAGFLCSESGRIGLTGIPIGESAFTRVAFEETVGPLIAVVPVCHKGKRTISAWKLTNARSSWAWNGWEGAPATVEVYARAAEVELQINGTAVGRKRLKNSCRATFQTTYQDGTLTAISYDEQGREISRSELHSAGQETELRVVPECTTVEHGHLAYVNVRYTDRSGLLKPTELHKLTVSVSGGRLLAFGNANPYQAESPLTNRSETYYGEAQAIILADQCGTMTIRASDGSLASETQITIS